MYDDDTEVARNCKVFDDYLALSCILGAGLRTERLQFRISTSTIQPPPIAIVCRPRLSSP